MKSQEDFSVCFSEERLRVLALCVFMTVWFFKDRYENPPTFSSEHSVSAE